MEIASCFGSGDDDSDDIVVVVVVLYEGINKMSTLNTKALLDLLKAETFTSLVDPSLPNRVSDETSRRISEIQNTLIQLGAAEDLKMSQTFLNQIQTTFIEVLVDAEKELFNDTTDVRISPAQAQTLEQLMSIQFLLQSKQTLITDAEVINELYSRILNLSVTKELGQHQLRTLLESEREGKATFGPSVIRYTNVPFSKLVGIDEVRDQLQNIVSREFLSDEYTMVILTGPPGTGKSTLSHAIATAHSGGYYYNLNIGELSSPTIGVTEKGLRDLFQVLESSTQPVTLILDEVDNIFSDQLAQPHLQSVKITLQTEISGSRSLGKNVFIVGITNHYDRIEDVIKRRATSIIYVPLPKVETQMQYIMSLLIPARFVLTDQWRVAMDGLIRTKRYTNANLKHLTRNAKIKFFERMSRVPSGFPTITVQAEKLIVTPDVYLVSPSTPIYESESQLREFTRASPNNKLILVPSVEDFRSVQDSVFSLTPQDIEISKQKNDPAYLRPPARL